MELLNKSVGTWKIKTKKKKTNFKYDTEIKSKESEKWLSFAGFTLKSLVVIAGGLASLFFLFICLFLY